MRSYLRLMAVGVLVALALNYFLARPSATLASTETYTAPDVDFTVDAYLVHDWDVTRFYGGEARFTIEMTPGFRGYARWECNDYTRGWVAFSWAASQSSDYTLAVGRSNAPNLFTPFPTSTTTCAFHVFADASNTGRFKVTNVRFVMDIGTGGGGVPTAGATGSALPTLAPTTTPAPVWTYCPQAVPSDFIGPPGPSLCPLPTPTPTAGPATDCDSSSYANPIDIWDTNTQSTPQVQSGSPYGDKICWVRLHSQGGRFTYYRWWLDNIRSGNCTYYVQWREGSSSGTSGGTLVSQIHTWDSCNGTSSFWETNARSFTDGTIASIWTETNGSGYSLSQQWKIAYTDVSGNVNPTIGPGGYPTAGPTGTPLPPPPTEPPAQGGNAGPSAGPINICPLPRPSPEIQACVHVTPWPTLGMTPDPSGMQAAWQDVYNHLMSKAPFGYVQQAVDAIGAAASDAAGGAGPGSSCFGCIHLPLPAADGGGSVDAPIPFGSFVGAFSGIRSILLAILWIGVAVAGIRWAFRALGTSGGSGSDN